MYNKIVFIAQASTCQKKNHKKGESKKSYFHRRRTLRRCLFKSLKKSLNFIRLWNCLWCLILMFQFGLKLLDIKLFFSLRALFPWLKDWCETTPVVYIFLHFLIFQPRNFVYIPNWTDDFKTYTATMLSIANANSYIIDSCSRMTRRDGSDNSNHMGFYYSFVSTSIIITFFWPLRYLF